VPVRITRDMISPVCPLHVHPVRAQASAKRVRIGTGIANVHTYARVAGNPARGRRTKRQAEG